ncbi:MAG TPA: hypothetical protein VI299_23635 [Polyangiales bacterium]
MTHFPPPRVHEQRKRILKYVGMALSALMVLTVLTVLTLIVRNESAHDEAKCPFTQVSERPFDGGYVIEQQRSCVNGISERRYLLTRPGKPQFELARKRLASERFEGTRYHWEATTDAQKRVVIKMILDGKPSSEFREEDAAR